MTISRNTVHHVLEGACDNITEYSTSCVRGDVWQYHGIQYMYHRREHVTISRNTVHHVSGGESDNITECSTCIREGACGNITEHSTSCFQRWWRVWQHYGIQQRWHCHRIEYMYRGGGGVFPFA